MGFAFTAAYEAAEQFSRLYAARQPGAGFLKTILLRRIGSSARAGLDTARHLLDRLDDAGIPEEESGDEGRSEGRSTARSRRRSNCCEKSNEIWCRWWIGRDIDPKVEVILHYLRDGGWLETNGAIIFSQYRATAEWVAEALCAAFPDEPVALYAGGAASFVQRGRTAGRPDASKSRRRSSAATSVWSARPMPHARG